MLGPSGSGKTTLLEMLGLLERPDEGRVLYDGRPVDNADHVRLQLAAVFQRPYLFKGPVTANVEYGLVGARHSCKRTARACRGGTRARRTRRLRKRSAMALSGGEAQRVSLARASVMEPRILLFDEPLASLDRLLRRQLIRDFATILTESGVTVV